MKTMLLIAAIFSLLIITADARAAETASATITLASMGGTVGNPVFNYDLTLTDTGTTNLGTFWFAWVPGQDFLKSMPTSVINPSGWTSQITNGGSSDGFAIQWVATTVLTPGKSLNTFGFSSPDNLATVTGLSPKHPATLSPTSFVYIGQPLTDPGFELVASTAVLPEPASLGLILTVVGCLLMRAPRRTRIAGVSSGVCQYGLRVMATIA